MQATLVDTSHLGIVRLPPLIQVHAADGQWWVEMILFLLCVRQLLFPSSRMTSRIVCVNSNDEHFGIKERSVVSSLF